MMPNAFPPPFTLASGLDFTRIGPLSSAIRVKLYSMHWAMMLRFYGDTLRQANPQISDKALVRALVRWFDLADDDGLPALDDYRYPEPNEAHPVGLSALARKIHQAQADAGTTPILALAHGYGPIADFRQRLQTAHRASKFGFWINRYGYLSDEKMAAVREVSRG